MDREGKPIWYCQRYHVEKRKFNYGKENQRIKEKFPKENYKV